MRALAQIVEMEQPELGDAEDGAEGPDRDDDGGEGQRPRAPREAVDHRDDQEQHQLLAVDQAGRRVDRVERREDGGDAVGGQPPEHHRDLDALVVDPHHRRPAGEGDGQHDVGRRDRELRGGEEADQRPDGDDLELVVAEDGAPGARSWSSSCAGSCRQHLFHRRHHVAGPDAGQAPEVVGHAPTLVARPAGQVEPLDGPGSVSPAGRHGADRTGSVGPYSPTIGTSDVAATWRGPLSPPT